VELTDQSLNIIVQRRARVHRDRLALFLAQDLERSASHDPAVARRHHFRCVGGLSSDTSCEKIVTRHPELLLHGVFKESGRVRATEIVLVGLYRALVVILVLEKSDVLLVALLRLLVPVLGFDRLHKQNLVLRVLLDGLTVDLFNKL